MTSRDSAHRPPRLAWQIGAAFSSRLLVNTARRFIYTFAPVLSRGLGVPLTAITSMIAVNQLTGLLSLLFGPLGDRWGYRILMLTGLGSLVAGMLMAGFFPFYPTVLAAMILGGLAKSIFDPSLLAYAGQHIPFDRRGLAVGVLEMSWAGSSLAGIPLVGLLIAHYGWRSPFFVLGILGIMGLTALAILLPKSRPASPATREPVHLTKALGHLARERSALGTLVFAFCISGANDSLFVVYGIWLEKGFGLSIVALGLATTVIGVAELLGEGLIATLADRFGLKQSVMAGAILSGIFYALLPLMGRNLPLALSGLFLLFLSFEFTIVGCISFFTELLPDARATMMAGYMAASGIGRVFGAMAGGPVWMSGGIWAVGITSAIATGVGLAFLIWGVHDWQPGLKQAGAGSPS